MTVKVPPHRPTPGELEAARQMDLPVSEEYVMSLFELAGRADLQAQPMEVLHLLCSAALARPDDPRIYDAFAKIYVNLERNADAAACFSQAAVLRAPKP